MDALQLHGSPLLRLFRAFFVEVLRLKHAIDSEPAATEAEDPLISAVPRTAEAIRARLLHLIEQQLRALGEDRGEFEQRRRAEVRYVMAASADEVFITTAWSGQAAYKEDHLEHRLFHSHDAGERFFRGIDEILQRRDPSRVEIAAVYLLSLSLGFRGKYRNTDDGGRIEGYKRELHAFIASRDADPTSVMDRFFSQAYANTLDERRDQRLARVRPWAFGLLAVFVGYVLFGHLIWIRETTEIRDAVQLIQNARSR
jgi:type VI secretion system protein ImpK